LRPGWGSPRSSRSSSKRRCGAGEKELRDGGLPVTDAREMAEREELMLESETDMPEDQLDEALPPLPVEIFKELERK
jgi:hypothetical protein